jgi:hypothetical protein
MICPYCEMEVGDSAIEAEDGFCPECGTYIMKSSFRDSFDDLDDDDDDDFDDDELEDFEDNESESEMTGFGNVDFDEEPPEGYENDLELDEDDDEEEDEDELDKHE